jgi:NAD(P)-dependent dehydrogenase (short-subunit alcohol dehydrogenase family)
MAQTARAEQYRHGRPGLTVSGRTQFANDLFATELADRVRGTRIQVTCVHPGLVRTGVFRNAHGLPRIARMVAPHVQRLFARPPAVGARTPVYLAQDPQASAVNGMFFGPRCKPRTVPGGRPVGFDKIRRMEPGGEALENRWSSAAVRRYRAGEPTSSRQGRAVVHPVRPAER